MLFCPNVVGFRARCWGCLVTGLNLNIFYMLIPEDGNRLPKHVGRQIVYVYIYLACASSCFLLQIRNVKAYKENLRSLNEKVTVIY
jgi:hypothetical protein